jgi:hypothetical protein
VAPSIPSDSQMAAITAARVPPSREGDDVKVERLPEPFAGVPRLIVLLRLDSPFEEPLSSDRCLRPELVREVPHEPLHQPCPLDPFV